VGLKLFLPHQLDSSCWWDTTLPPAITAEHLLVDAAALASSEQTIGVDRVHFYAGAHQGAN
jgi:hypothetical protein